MNNYEIMSQKNQYTWYFPLKCEGIFFQKEAFNEGTNIFENKDLRGVCFKKDK